MAPPADHVDMAEHRTDIVIRRASAADTRVLWRLAALDNAPAPAAAPDVLIAEIDGEPVAAVAGGRAIADPFRRTAELVELLHVRAHQVDGAPSRSRAAKHVAPRPLAQV
jgi:hypothetical protein